ncbi:MAG: hypothetical protein FWC73_12025 [Defluviitaleaceae bacterium]|nr:hypothetical protein [Defluviitaleaceae bacterium]
MHQLIYTTCARGIDGRDGQQVFSRTETFPKNAQAQVQNLFRYHSPKNLPLTAESARALPPIFTYRRLEGGGNVIALNTMLTEGGRLGNNLCHVLLCDPHDIKTYPMEYYGTLLTTPPPETKTSAVPDYLPEPILEKGNIVSLGAVIDFLEVDNRKDVLKKMAAAMLQYSRTRKPVVILDSHANTQLWIAALHYTLPLHIALGVDFSTYEYDPSASPSRICGVLRDGTAFDIQSQNAYFIFDVEQNEFTDIGRDNSFENRVLDMITDFEFENGFHEFVEDYIEHSLADEKIFGIYELYMLNNDFNIKKPMGISSEKFTRLTELWHEFALKEKQDNLVMRLLQHTDEILDADNSHSRIICDFITGYILTQKDFVNCLHKGEYVKKLVEKRYKTDPNACFAFVKRILARATASPSALGDMAIFIVSCFTALLDTQDIRDAIWKQVANLARANFGNKTQELYGVLLNRGYGNAVFEIYSELYHLSNNFLERRQTFNNHWHSVKRDHIYLSKHREEITMDYYRYLKQLQIDETGYGLEKSVMHEILDFFVECAYAPVFFYELVDTVFAHVPLTRPGDSMWGYLVKLGDAYAQQNVILKGRLLLLVVAANLDRKMDLGIKRIFEKIWDLAGGREVDITGMDSYESKEYIEWVVSGAIEACNPLELAHLYRIFAHTTETATEFISACAQHLRIHDTKNSTDNLTWFLEFLFDITEYDDKDRPLLIAAGSQLPKLKDLNRLNKAVQARFAGTHPDWKEKWSLVKGAAGSKSK